MIKTLRRLESDLAAKLPVFGSEEFIAARSSDYGWFTSADFVLPFIVDRKFVFKRLVFTTEAVRLREGLTTEDEAAFLDQVIAHCAKRKDVAVDFIATPQANAVFGAVPSQSESIEWGSFVVDLAPSQVAIFEAFHSKHRNTIRKAETSGVSIGTTTDCELVYRSIRETMMRQRLYFFPSLTYLAELQQRLGDRITFYTATHQGTLQGVAVVVHNHLGGFYFYGGSTAHPFTGSLNLMQYEIMKDLKRKNVPVYDLMGARIDTCGNPKIEGIQRFKSRFSSGMRRGYSFRRIFHPVRHRLFVATVKAYFFLKGARYEGDVIDQTQNAPPTRIPVAESAS